MTDPKARLVSRAIAHPLAFWGRVGVAVVALTGLFGARGQPRLMMALAAVIPLVVFALDAPFRRRQFTALQELWADLHRKSAEWRKWWAALVFVALPAAVLYLWHPYFHGNSGDTWAALPTALQVVRHGNTEISDFIASAPPAYTVSDPMFEGLPYGTKHSHGGIYSRYPVGMTVLALPTAALGIACGADTHSGAVLSALERLSAVTVAMLVLVLFFRVALVLASPGVVVLASWFLALGSGVHSTVAQLLWQHGGVTIGALTILLVELVPWFHQRRGSVILEGIAIGLMYACRLSSGWLVLVIGVGILIRSPRRAVVVALVGAIGVIPWLAYYQIIYDSPLGPSQSQLDSAGWRWEFLGPLLGVLVSPSHGLLVYQPWVLLAVVGLVMRWRDCWAWVFAVAGVGHTLLVARWPFWWGGACWGSRLLTEVQPLFLLLALPLLTRLCQSHSGRVFLGVLFLWSMVVHLSGVWQPQLLAFWDQEDEVSMWGVPNLFL